MSVVSPSCNNQKHLQTVSYIPLWGAGDKVPPTPLQHCCMRSSSPYNICIYNTTVENIYTEAALEIFGEGFLTPQWAVIEVVFQDSFILTNKVFFSSYRRKAEKMGKARKIGHIKLLAKCELQATWGSETEYNWSHFKVESVLTYLLLTFKDKIHHVFKQVLPIYIQNLEISLKP